MNTHYLAVNYDESPSLGGTTALSLPDGLTIAEAVRKMTHVSDYIVAVENGVVRPLTQSEESEVKKVIHEYLAS